MIMPTPLPTPLPTPKQAANPRVHCAHAAHAAIRMRAHANACAQIIYFISRVYIYTRGRRGLSGYKGYRAILAWATAWADGFMAWARYCFMKFRLGGEYWMESETGYVICKCKSGGGWLYLCYAPDMPRDEFNAALKIHYQQGERVPVRNRYICTQPDRRSAEAACRRHFEGMK